MPNKLIGLKIFVLSFLIIFLTSCGFHMRGMTPAEKLPESLQTIYISANDLYGPFMKILIKTFENQGASVSTEPSTPYRLSILEENYTRRTVTVTERSKVAEYEMRAEILYELKNQAGQTVIGPDRIFAEKVYVFNQNAVLGKSEEEAIIKREMQQELAQRLVRRLRIQMPALINKAENDFDKPVTDEGLQQTNCC